jgi:hypothetical protein
MDPTRFELAISIPRDDRFAATLRGLAEHAAHYAGCGDAAAGAFGRDVEQAVRAHFAQLAADAVVPVVLRRQDGPVELLIDSRTISVDV